MERWKCKMQQRLEDPRRIDKINIPIYEHEVEILFHKLRR